MPIPGARGTRDGLRGGGCDGLAYHGRVAVQRDAGGHLQAGVEPIGNEAGLLLCHCINAAHPGEEGVGLTGDQLISGTGLIILVAELAFGETILIVVGIAVPRDRKAVRRTPVVDFAIQLIEFSRDVHLRAVKTFKRHRQERKRGGFVHLKLQGERQITLDVGTKFGQRERIRRIFGVSGVESGSLVFVEFFIEDIYRALAGDLIIQRNGTLFFRVIQRHRDGALGGGFVGYRLPVLGRGDGQGIDVCGDKVGHAAVQGGIDLAVDGPRQLGVGFHGEGLAPEQGAAVAEEVVLGDVQIGPFARADGANRAPQGGQQARRVIAPETGFHRHIRAGGHRGDNDAAVGHGVDRARNPDFLVLAGCCAGDGHVARVAVGVGDEGEVIGADAGGGGTGQGHETQAGKRRHTIAVLLVPNAYRHRNGVLISGKAQVAQRLYAGVAIGKAHIGPAVQLHHHGLIGGSGNCQAFVCIVHKDLVFRSGDNFAENDAGHTVIAVCCGDRQFNDLIDIFVSKRIIRRWDEP